MKTPLERVVFLNDHCSDGGFLQSDEWLEFQRVSGHSVWNVPVSDETKSLGVIEYRLPLVGTYWYAPRIPNSVTPDTMRAVLEESRQAGVGWLRFDLPNAGLAQIWRKEFFAAMRRAPHMVQPRENLVLPLGNSEENLLARMKSKARYNIRLAERKGVRIFLSRKQEHIERFCDLVEETALRDGIVPHPRSHYVSMIQTIPEEMLALYCAEYKGKVVAANLVVFFGKFATYLHGASANESRESMAPALLQWRQMRDALAKGCTHYDFGGIKTDVSSDGSWTGITQFKRGFAPDQPSTFFAGTFDIPVRPFRYACYMFGQKTAAFIRRFRKVLQKSRKGV